MDQTLRLNDGTVLEGHCLVSDADLFIYLDASTLADAYPLLSDPGRTKRITADSYGEKTVYKGYTHLYCIREETTGMVSAGLRKVMQDG